MKMKKDTLILILIVVIIVLIIGGFVYNKVQNDRKLLANVQDKTILFYREDCPHCINVENFIKDNNIESKVQLEKKEASKDEQNSYLMTLIAGKKCSIPSNELGVPFLWDGSDSKCFLGDQDIINFFKQKIGI